jgi:hypothetical protein
VSGSQPSPSEQAQRFIARHPWAAYASRLTPLWLRARKAVLTVLIAVQLWLARPYPRPERKAVEH